MKDILTTIPKVAQWQGIPYAFNFTCQECGCSSIGDIVTKPNLVGWCDTPRGFMMVFECPKCFSKFRCHCNTGDKFNKERFEYSIYEYICHGENYLIGNAAELYKLIEDETE